jgi:hypothetical protein
VNVYLDMGQGAERGAAKSRAGVMNRAYPEFWQGK